MTALEIRHRTVPDRLAYLAAKLREGDKHREAVAIGLELLADETGATALQDRAATWHAARYPSCTPEDIALKSMAELGEVADAILAEGRDGSHPERAGTVLAEVADVLVTLLSLCGRFGHGDLLGAADAKLSLLETRGGPHPGCLPAGVELTVAGDWKTRVSPNGVGHAVPPAGPCATRGKSHEAAP